MGLRRPAGSPRNSSVDCILVPRATSTLYHSQFSYAVGVLQYRNPTPPSPPPTPTSLRLDKIGIFHHSISFQLKEGLVLVCLYVRQDPGWSYLAGICSGFLTFSHVSCWSGPGPTLTDGNLLRWIY